MTGRRLAWTIAAGVAIGALATLSPLLPVAAALAFALVWLVGRGLPDNERRAVMAVVIVAIVARVLVVMALAIWSLPAGASQSGGVLFGDEAYLYERSLRTRDLVLGLPVGKHDFMMAFEEYADTKYTWWLAWMQTTFGPAPYMIRVVNGLLFVAAACVLYRLARRGFGETAARWALAVVVFLPSALFWSVSLLKDSAFFFFTAVAVASVVRAVRSPALPSKLAWIALLLVMLWALSDLRPAAIVLTGGGIALGLLIRLACQTRARQLSAALVVVALAATTAAWPRVSEQVLAAMTLLSRQHMGHATMPGRPYKTLDDRFYPDWYGALDGKTLSGAEAARYVARSTVAFLTVPQPWRVGSTRELAVVPEQLVWYGIAALALLGIAAAYRRDALLTTVLVGYILAMSGAVALTNGNVGTLIRLRGLVTRFVVWIAAVGLLWALARMARARVRT